MTKESTMHVFKRLAASWRSRSSRHRRPARRGPNALLVFGLVLVAPLACATTISVGAFTPSATPFIVPILVTDAVDLASFTFDLAYDPAQYAIVTTCDRSGVDPYCDAIDGPVTLGAFYAGYALFPPLFVPGFVFTDATGSQTGTLSGVDGAWQDIAPPPSGDGILAFVEFVTLTTAPTTPISVVGTPPASVPEPEPLSLICGSLFALGLQRHRRGARRDP